MKQRTRTLLGKLTSMIDRERVYLCDDAIEKDLVEGYDVETRRLFFSDMEMMTWHLQYSKVGLWLSGLSLGLGLIILLIVIGVFRVADTSNAASMAGWVTFWFAVAPNIPFLAWFLRPYAYVTVYGKRNRATMSWHFRHAESKRVFEEVSQLVREAQTHARQQLPQIVSVPAALAPPSDVPSMVSAEPMALASPQAAPEAPAPPPVPPALHD